MIRTCIITSGNDTVTIGWANVAQYGHLRAWVRQRMAIGYKYIITTEPMAREVIYNNATKINLRVDTAELANAAREIGEFLAAGDVSIVRLTGPRTVLRMASTAAEVLDHDVIEIQPTAKPLTPAAN